MRVAAMAAFMIAITAWAVAPARAAGARTVETAAMPGGVTLPYYVSAPEAATSLVVGIQGYDRDANRTFDAVTAAVSGQPGVMVVAPIFEVDAQNAARCHHKGVPGAAAGNALWTCGGWATGQPATNADLTSFQAMDALLADLHRQSPLVKQITIAGFSAGGQFVQHYIGFAHPPAGVAMRYVVSDPSAFVYFDRFRPYQVDPASCPKWNDWRYGLDNLPPALGRSASAARAAYVAADITYLEGGDDTGTSKAASYRLLEKNCQAEAEGPFRRARGEAFAAYDGKMLAMGRHRLIIVPGCAHSVSCVFPKAAAAISPQASSRAAP